MGGAQAIPAFEEAVAGMVSGGLRRIEVPGTRPQLSYARERSERFANELFGEGSKYRHDWEGVRSQSLCTSSSFMKKTYSRFYGGDLSMVYDGSWCPSLGAFLAAY